MLIHPGIDPVAFSLGPVLVRWYGLMYVFAFFAAWGPEGGSGTRFSTTLRRSRRTRWSCSGSGAEACPFTAVSLG